MIQIVGINAGTLLELLCPFAKRPRINAQKATATREKGGVRIAEAAFELGKTGVLARFRFTER